MFITQRSAQYRRDDLVPSGTNLLQGIAFAVKEGYVVRLFHQFKRFFMCSYKNVTAKKKEQMGRHKEKQKELQGEEAQYGCCPCCLDVSNSVRRNFPIITHLLGP